MKTLETLNFDNQFARLDEAFYTRLTPTPLHDVRLVTSNPEAARLLDLDPAEFHRPEFLEYFSGQKLHPQFEPLAMIYSGHQFGVYNPQLGDGRGILLGEVRNENGEYWDIHLKGAGKTPYSRFGDGRAVLRSCIREYLGSEALHYLGIPTSRALCIFGSREPVRRETIEQGAALIRLSPSHVRFGSFEYFFYTRQEERLQELADYVIDRHFPDIRHADNPYAELFRAAVSSTAEMIAKWQAFGFAHGVMNTDNMSILGITFDYGPFGFLEDFVPGYICNHSDERGRYAFHQQPGIALWNLNALAQALTPLVPQQVLVEALRGYERKLLDAFHTLMLEKLGLTLKQDDDIKLVTDLIGLLTDNHPDYTIFFRRLSHLGQHDNLAPVADLFIDRDAARIWLQRYLARTQQEAGTDHERLQRMLGKNPKYILRNYLAQNAIALAEKGDFSEVENLRRLLLHPFDEQPENERYADFPPDWGKSLEISCSS